MAFTVNLYNHTKRENSTLRPSSSPGATYSCVVRTGTGILNPTIELDIGLVTSPASFNYAYIQEFQRYYFIEDWRFEDRLWTAIMKVDALATYKTPIGNADLYVLRSSNASDGNIIDSLYPTKTNCTFYQDIKSALWAEYVDYGIFVLGVVSDNPHYGSLNYIACDSTAMAEIVNGLMTDTITQGHGFTDQDASYALQLSLIDPLQYIKSCVYIPVAIGNIPGSAITTVRIFNYDIPVPQGSAKRIGASPAFTKSLSFTIQKHPQTQARGNFVNVTPYTTGELYVPPFGKIPIDTSVTALNTTLTANINIDCPTGRAIMEVKAGDVLINKVESNVGVNVQLSQLARDITTASGAIQSGIGLAAGAHGARAFTAGALEPLLNATGITGKISGIADAASSLGLKVSNVGEGGSYAQLLELPRLDMQFLPIVDDDNAQNGRPLCQMRNVATLGGYMLIQDGDVPIDGTAAEGQTIRNYLEGGFYYE